MLYLYTSQQTHLSRKNWGTFNTTKPLIILKVQLKKSSVHHPNGTTLVVPPKTTKDEQVLSEHHREESVHFDELDDPLTIDTENTGMHDIFLEPQLNESVHCVEQEDLP